MSQNKFVNPNTIHWFYFSLRWVFMISFIVALINWIQTVMLIDFIITILFLHWSIKFYLAEKHYLDDLFKTYNQQVDEINKMPRRKRRKIIAKYKSNSIK